MDTTPTERHALPGVGELVGSSRSNRAWRRLKCTGLTPALFLVALMAGPVVMYLALVHHAEREALKDARAFSSMISIVRSYYASNVTGRIMAAGGVQVSLSENYREIAGGVPIPATLSVELGDKIRTDSVDQSMQFSFVSDAPFLRRPRPPLTDFQGEALKSFRRRDRSSEYWRVEDNDGVARLRLAVPVRMEAGCVSCHNVHPDSPVRNWKVGDVRGIQEVSVDLAVLEQADQSGLVAGYMLFFLDSGLLALGESRRNNARLRRVNEDLDAAQRQGAQREAQLKDTVDELGTETTVIERAPFGVLLAASGGAGLSFSYVNPASCQQTGYRAEALQGAGLNLLFGPQTAAPSMQALHTAIQGIQPHADPRRRQRDLGRRQAAVAAAWQRRRGGQGQPEHRRGGPGRAPLQQLHRRAEGQDLRPRRDHGLLFRARADRRGQVAQRGLPGRRTRRGRQRAHLPMPVRRLRRPALRPQPRLHLRARARGRAHRGGAGDLRRPHRVQRVRQPRIARPGVVDGAVGAGGAAAGGGHRLVFASHATDSGTRARARRGAGALARVAGSR